MAAINITTKEFEKLLLDDKPLLVDYWAPWCSYCRRIGPAYDRVAERWAEDVHVVKVNIDEEPDLARQEQIEVIPTLVLYRGGAALDSIVAPQSGATIENMLRNALS